MRLFLFSLIIFTFSFQSFGLEKNLVKIFSEPEGGITHKLNIIVDKDYDVVGFKRITKSSKIISYFSLQELVEKEVSLGTIKHPKGNTLRPFILQCSNCDSTQGGDLTIKFLRSGVNPNRLKYKNFELRLVRERDNWFLLYKNEKVKNLKLVSRKIFGNLVGIKKIEVNP